MIDSQFVRAVYSQIKMIEGLEPQVEAVQWIFSGSGESLSDTSVQNIGSRQIGPRTVGPRSPTVRGPTVRGPINLELESVTGFSQEETDVRQI